MLTSIDRIFSDKKLVSEIKQKLPYLFQLAEIESSRAGKIGMEVGSLRERIIIALLIYVFGEENVETEIPITESEVDVKLFKQPISIKTITGLSGVKLIWTVDKQKAEEFLERYVPSIDMLLVHINWKGDKVGGLYYFPYEVQRRIFKEMGREKYIKLPKPGTNPRGVELSKAALVKLMGDEGTERIRIRWVRRVLDFNPYRRWVEYWKQNII